MEQVTVAPTLGEAFHYANMSGQWLWTIIGIILFAVAGYMVWALGTYKWIVSTGKVIGVGVVVALALASILSKPIAISLNNDKVVSKSYLEQVGKKYILDSVYNNNLMIDAASK